MCLASTGTILEIRSQAPEGEHAVAGSDPLWREGLVDFEGVRCWVSLACLTEARCGERVVVHVGLAIAHEDDMPD